MRPPHSQKHSGERVSRVSLQNGLQILTSLSQLSELPITRRKRAPRLCISGIEFQRPLEIRHRLAHLVLLGKD